MKILFFCSLSLRDILFSTPVLRGLKIQCDHVVIHYALPKEFLPVLEDNPYLDVLIPSGDMSFSSFRSGQYDVMIDLGSQWHHRIYARLAGIKVLTYPRQRWAQWLMTKLKINKLRSRHLVDRMMVAIEALGVRSDDMGLDYFIPERDVISPAWLPEGFQQEFVLLSIAAPYATRKLPVDRLIELCDKINKPVIITGGKEDKETGNTIARFFERNETSFAYEEGLRELNKKTIIFNGTGRFNTNQVASLVRRARCVFTFDNEMVAIASAFKKQVYLLLGNTITLFGSYPYRTKFVILENNSLSCRPCSSQGYGRCPKGHFKCMRDIAFDFYIP